MNFNPTANQLNPYEARIRVNNKSTYLGCYSTAEEAALAYARAAEERRCGVVDDEEE